MATFNQTLEQVMELDFSSREMLLEIVRKRMIEESWVQMAKEAAEGLSDFRKGKLIAQTAKDIIADLDKLV